MAGFWRIALAVILLLAPAVSAPVHALIPAAPEAAENPAPAEPQIASTAEAGSDKRITARIRDIFSQLPSLSAVTVSVSKGVVSLTGTVPDAAAKTRAETIAGRVDGVVTVENALERDVSVDGNLGALDGLSDKVDGFVAMLPLIAAAIAVGLTIGLIGYLIAGFSALWRKVAPNSFLAE